ncbi:MAG: 4-oxalocrotonate tautomerase family protein [Kangiellaceae bacterium]|nr:4-oxalocrotonate tautomerase family protein [Kangiellaceae bacterium]
MPFVTIRITDENVSKQEKQKLIVGVTDLLQNVLGKNPKTTHVIIEEVNTDNWGIAGEQVTELRERAG